MKPRQHIFVFPSVTSPFILGPSSYCIDRDVAMPIVSAIVFSLGIAIVSIVFRHTDFHFKIVWLDSNRKLNGNRMYIVMPPMHFNKISGLRL